MITGKIIWFDEVNSTNTYIKSNYRSLENGNVIAAKHQTNGYGRLNRKWYEKSNQNLTFSIYLKLPLKENLAIITQAIACSVYQTLCELNVSSKIKWPNDILVKDKKICGILVETIIDAEYANTIIGIGLNVNSESFHESIMNKATSLLIETGSSFEISEVLDILLKNINYNIMSYLSEDYKFLDVCRSNSYLIGKRVLLENQKTTALVKGIDNFGRLVVEINNKEELFIGSEVSLDSTYCTKEN